MGLVNNDTTATFSRVLATAATSSSGVGGYAITEGTLSELGNYTIGTFNPGTLTIRPAPLTITANNASTFSGAPLPPLSVSYVGFVNGDSPGNLARPPVVSTSATSSSPAGAYPIAVSEANSADYVINYVNGVLSVAPAAARVQSVSIQKIRMSRRKSAQVIVVQFSAAVNTRDAQDPGNYHLATVASKRQRSKSIGIARAVYDAANNSVTLMTSKALVLTSPLRLTIHAAGLLDSFGRPLDGNGDGQPGGNFATTIG